MSKQKLATAVLLFLSSTLFAQSGTVEKNQVAFQKRAQVSLELSNYFETRSQEVREAFEDCREEQLGEMPAGEGRKETYAIIFECAAVAERAKTLIP